MTNPNPPATNGDLSREQGTLGSTRMMQDRSCLDKALKVIESRILGWATSFGTTNHIGLKAGYLFIDPLHQMHEGGSKVFFAVVEATYTAL